MVFQTAPGKHSGAASQANEGGSPLLSPRLQWKRRETDCPDLFDKTVPSKSGSFGESDRRAKAGRPASPKAGRPASAISHARGSLNSTDGPTGAYNNQVPFVLAHDNDTALSTERSGLRRQSPHSNHDEEVRPATYSYIEVITDEEEHPGTSVRTGATSICLSAARNGSCASAVHLPSGRPATALAAAPCNPLDYDGYPSLSVNSRPQTKNSLCATGRPLTIFGQRLPRFPSAEIDRQNSDEHATLVNPVCVSRDASAAAAVKCPGLSAKREPISWALHSKTSPFALPWNLLCETVFCYLDVRDLTRLSCVNHLTRLYFLWRIRLLSEKHWRSALSDPKPGLMPSLDTLLRSSSSCLLWSGCEGSFNVSCLTPSRFTSIAKYNFGSLNHCEDPHNEDAELSHSSLCSNPTREPSHGESLNGDTAVEEAQRVDRSVDSGLPPNGYRPSIALGPTALRLGSWWNRLCVTEARFVSHLIAQCELRFVEATSDFYSCLCQNCAAAASCSGHLADDGTVLTGVSSQAASVRNDEPRPRDLYPHVRRESSLGATPAVQRLHRATPPDSYESRSATRRPPVRLAVAAVPDENDEGFAVDRSVNVPQTSRTCWRSAGLPRRRSFNGSPGRTPFRWSSVDTAPPFGATTYLRNNDTTRSNQVDPYEATDDDGTDATGTAAVSCTEIDETDIDDCINNIAIGPLSVGRPVTRSDYHNDSTSETSDEMSSASGMSRVVDHRQQVYHRQRHRRHGPRVSRRNGDAAFQPLTPESLDVTSMETVTAPETAECLLQQQDPHQQRPPQQPHGVCQSEVPTNVSGRHHRSLPPRRRPAGHFQRVNPFERMYDRSTHSPTSNIDFQDQGHHTEDSLSTISPACEEAMRQQATFMHQLTQARKHTSARLFLLFEILFQKRASIEYFDFNSPAAFSRTCAEDASELPAFPADLRAHKGTFEFPKLTHLRFGQAVDCRYIVPLLDFGRFPKLSFVAVLGLPLAYELGAPQFGVKPTLVYGPQYIFGPPTALSDRGGAPLWLPAVYNGAVDEQFQLQGRGVYSSRQYHYEGTFVNGRNEGYGRMVSRCGETYEGEWREGRRHGNGVVLQSDGRVLRGTWYRDSLHGRGSMEMVDGLLYEGEWKFGVLEGWGVLSKNGQLLAVGQFSDGRPHGWLISRSLAAPKQGPAVPPITQDTKNNDLHTLLRPHSEMTERVTQTEEMALKTSLHNISRNNGVPRNFFDVLKSGLDRHKLPEMLAVRHSAMVYGSCKYGNIEGLKVSGCTVAQPRKKADLGYLSIDLLIQAENADFSVEVDTVGFEPCSTTRQSADICSDQPGFDLFLQDVHSVKLFRQRMHTAVSKLIQTRRHSSRVLSLINQPGWVCGWKSSTVRSDATDALLLDAGLLLQDSQSSEGSNNSSAVRTFPPPHIKPPPPEEIPEWVESLISSFLQAEEARIILSRCV